MKKYKITIEYDGTKYKGWQRLNNSEKTIQEKIESILSKIIGEKIEIHGAGRTDAGVHAYNQVAHFETKNELDANKILIASHEMLPQDIVFKDLVEVSMDFHARYSAKAKYYIYKIWNHQIPTALQRKYTYHVPSDLNIEHMKDAASYLVGKHDFQSFTANKSKKKSMVRELYQIEIIKNGSEIVLHFHGEGFLYKMVRIITGTLIEVGLGEIKPEEIKEILNKKTRQYAGNTAPSHGLYLNKVEY